MICKNCLTEYDDSCLFCPECGQPKENIPDGFQREDRVVHVVYEEDDLAEEEGYAVPSYDGEEETEASAEKDESKGEQQEVGEADEAPVEEEKSEKAKKVKPSKNETKAMLLMVAILLIVGAFTVVLTMLNVKGDAFEVQTNPQKTVALSKLSAEEEATLERELAAYFSALKQEFNSDSCTSEEFLSRVNPGDKGNFYSILVNSNEPLQTVADPAMRFEDEYGEYSYYKIEEGKLIKLLARFGLTMYGDVNCENYYYHDGFYYFNAAAPANTPIVSMDITKSKKVFDGSFYAEGHFYFNNGTDTIKSDTCYLVASKNPNSIGDGYTFIINKADNEPLFTDGGSPTAAFGVSGYKMQEKIIEGKASNGTVYCRYTLRYPVFSGTSAGEKSINAFFNGTLETYELKASSAAEDYNSFVSSGGNVAELPFTETVVTSVTYADDEKISFTERIASYSPKIPEPEEESTTSEDDEDYEDDYRDDYSNASAGIEQVQEPVELFTRTVEAYTFDKATGEFIEKDDILGENYMLISEILYRIYNGYEYDTVLAENVTQPVTDEFGNLMPTEPTTTEDDYYNDYSDEEYGYGDKENDGRVPEDEDGFGTVIYESASCFTKNGFTFYYVEYDGYVTEVTLPFSVIEQIV